MSMLKTHPMTSPDDVANAVRRFGFLPFFAGEVEGFSIEEMVHPDYWFPDDREGVWEWKSVVIASTDCAYGKFYRNKACFVSTELFVDLLNYRRSLVTLRSAERDVLDTIAAHESLTSTEAKKFCGFSTRRTSPKGGVPSEAEQQGRTKSSFDAIITRLQMSCWLLTATFEYKYDRQGRNYGWGIARYCTPEAFFGAERLVVGCSPEESRRRLEQHFLQLEPNLTSKQLYHLVGI